MLRDLKYAIVLVLILASFAVFAGFDPLVDLQDSTEINRGRCSYKGNIYTCFAVAKESNLYLVAVDKKGLVAVYSVKEVKAGYEQNEATLIWERKVYTREDT